MPSLHTASELSGLGEIILCSPMPEPLIYTTSANTVYLKGLWWGLNASKAVKVSSQLGHPIEGPHVLHESILRKGRQDAS